MGYNIKVLSINSKARPKRYRSTNAKNIVEEMKKATKVKVKVTQK